MIYILFRMGNSFYCTRPLRVGEKVYETAEQYDAMDSVTKSILIKHTEECIKLQFLQNNRRFYIFNSVLKTADHDDEQKFWNSYVKYNSFDDTRGVFWMRVDLLHNIIHKILKDVYDYKYVVSFSYNDQKIRPGQLFVTYSIVQ